MPMLLSALDPRVRDAAALNAFVMLLAPADFGILRRRLDRSLVSFSDCGRVMRDIALGVLCGATMGLFAAAVGDWF
jgi:hypothetical protein